MRRGEQPSPDTSLAGSLLLAHPTMRDPNFRRTVILISAHSADGALGVVINRPTDDTLGALQQAFAHGPLASVPVYVGGPVAEDQVILAAWHILPEQHAFRLFFGLEPERLAELQAEHEGLCPRAFRGYSGWSGGQLEGELSRDDWIVRPVDPEKLSRYSGVELWRRMVGEVSPALRLLAESPDDPSLN